MFIIGANGHTGTELIDLGLARGHQVTAFVRAAGKIARTDPRLNVVVGDPKSADSLAAALPGHDAVFSALGIRASEILRPITLLQDCAATTVAAMTRAGVKRLAIVSAATLFPGGGLMTRLVRGVLTNQVRDLVATEQIITATDLDWTIARPPKLDPTPVEHYRAEPGRLPDRAWAMSFRAVACFMLDAVEQGTHIREVVGLAA
jgi:putative NADH-flavin reductase